ncbi:MAG: hypothetical protein K0R71_1688 [Bacillales bacterium]|jgi:hypothetical protein|nr:hypothetical protein [Bacillales bacterium]
MGSFIAEETTFFPLGNEIVTSYKGTLLGLRPGTMVLKSNKYQCKMTIIVH